MSALFETYIGKTLDQESVMVLQEALDTYVNERTEEIEASYGKRFEALTEGVVNTLANLADKAADEINEKVVRDRTMRNLVESLDKIKTIFLEMGVMDASDLDGAAAMAKAVNDRKEADDKLARALEVGRKALSKIDEQKKIMESKDLEIYVLTNTKALSVETQNAAKDYILAKYKSGDMGIEDAEYELINFLEKNELPSNAVSASPAQATAAGLDEFEAALAQAEDEIKKPLTVTPASKPGKLFESANRDVISRPAPGANFLESLLKERGVKAQNLNTFTNDVNTAQLESITNHRANEASSKPVFGDVANTMNILNNMGRYR